MDLPDTILLHIYHFLNYREIVTAGAVCRKWHRVSKDEILWKRRFLQDFQLHQDTLPYTLSQTSWYSEYKRLIDEVPSVLSQTLRDHTDEVLHVSYSHDGSMFCTCSKDCTFKVWSNDYPYPLLFTENMRTQFNWHYTDYSQFNNDDTLLLINGVLEPNQSIPGQIAIFDIRQNELLYVPNEPFDVHSGWFGKGDMFMSANNTAFDNFRSADIILNNVPILNTVSMKMVVSTVLLKRFAIYLHTLIRMLLISDVVSEQLQNRFMSSNCNNQDHILIFATGFITDVPHLVCFKLINTTIVINQSGDLVVNQTQLEEQARGLSRSAVTAYLNAEYKRGDGMVPAALNSEAAGFLKSNFDFPDFVIDMSGSIIGMSLSHDRRFLFVNVRPWLEANPDSVDRPSIAEDAVLRVINLENLELVTDKVYQGHKGFTDCDSCFYNFVDSCNQYIASGSEDKFAYIWDRHYCVLVSKLAHDNVVSAVAFNPRSHGTLVSVSDDFTVKVWHSKRLAKHLNEHQKLQEQEEHVAVDHF